MAGKVFYLMVFLEVGFAPVLNVVIERHDNLFVVVDLGGADGHKLERDRPTIVVCHNPGRRQGDIVAGLDLLSGCKANRESLDDLLGQGLRSLDCRLGGGIYGVRG